MLQLFFPCIFYYTMKKKETFLALINGIVAHKVKRNQICKTKMRTLRTRSSWISFTNNIIGYLVHTRAVQGGAVRWCDCTPIPLFIRPL